MSDRAPAIVLPELPLAGGCQCGAVRYRIVQPPLTFYHCHCSTCRRQSGSAFGSSLMIHADALALSGPVTALEWVGGSGCVSDQRFCPQCGTRMSHRIRGRDTAVVKAGTLDDATWLHPAGHIFTDGRMPWIPPDPGVLDFPGAPDMAALIDRFQTMLGRASARREETT